jgi:peroxiredoxin
VTKFLSLLGIFLVSSIAHATTITPFSLPQMNSEPAGQMFNSADYSGRAWLIENYFNSCSYCNENAPKVNDLAAFYKDNPRVVFIDLGIDRQDSQYQSWISKHKPNHPVLKDSSRTVSGELGTQGYPTSYVMNCRMEIIWSHEGTWDDQGTIDEIKAKIDEALSTECPFYL